MLSTKKLLYKLLNVELTTSTQSGGTQYTIKFPIHKLQIVAGTAVFNVPINTSVDNGKIYTSAQQRVVFTNPFNTLYAGSANKTSMTANTGIYNNNFAKTSMDVTFWRGVSLGTATQQDVSYIAIGTYA